MVVPGLIYFAMKPDFLTQLPWTESRAKANNAYIDMVQSLIPVGLRGLLLAALFGAIQSTVSAVLNSTSTVFTVDFYKRHIRPNATEKEMVRIGVIAGVVFLTVAILLAYLMDKLKFNLFVYIQTLYTFFAPPFSASICARIGPSRRDLMILRAASRTTVSPRKRPWPESACVPRATCPAAAQ